MVSFVGFSAKEEPLIRAAYLEAKLCLDDAFSIRKEGSAHAQKYADARTKYFGALTPEKEKVVRGVIKAMKEATDRGTFKFVRAPADTSIFFKSGTLASTIAYGEKQQALVLHRNGETHKYRDVIIRAWGTGEPDPIKINDAFFSLSLREMDATNMVQTVLHELSHHAANTADETFAGIELYGAPGAWLAVQYGVAHNNAENYGFFVASLRLHN